MFPWDDDTLYELQIWRDTMRKERERHDAEYTRAWYAATTDRQRRALVIKHQQWLDAIILAESNRDYHGALVEGAAGWQRYSAGELEERPKPEELPPHLCPMCGQDKRTGTHTYCIRFQF